VQHGRNAIQAIYVSPTMYCLVIVTKTGKIVVSCSSMFFAQHSLVRIRNKSKTMIEFMRSYDCSDASGNRMVFFTNSFRGIDLPPLHDDCRVIIEDCCHFQNEVLNALAYTKWP